MTDNGDESQLCTELRSLTVVIRRHDNRKKKQDVVGSDGS
jgi:hypothetical protein